MTGDDVDRFFTLFAKRHTELVTAEEHADQPTLPDGATPRGLLELGLVRTTSWLQIGMRPVSSALVAALAALPIAVVIVAALARTTPVSGLVALLPALCYAGWRLLTVRLRPASTARNLGVASAEEVVAGSWVRLHGQIGPVAQVASTRVEDATVEVTFVGGAGRSWPHGHRLQLAEVLD